MHYLAIDIETYSSYDLPNCGVYKYVESPDFDILLFAYAVDFGEVQIVDLARREKLPKEILSALTDNSVIKTAYNATFERICLSKYLGMKLPIDQWQCTMVTAARVGYPMGLADCANAMGVVEKMSEGINLIRYFSKPTVKGIRRMPDDAPERWDLFKEYCKRDVEVEQAILKRVNDFPVPRFDRRLYILDQEINDRGIKLDTQLIKNAVKLNEEYTAQLMARAREITRLDNPNSITQVKEWIAKRTGMPIQSLAKGEMTDLIAKFKYYPDVQELLSLRAKMAKTSNAKYTAMQECICADGRVHGLMQFYGSHTGRWAGRLVQVQNLPQNHIADLDYARKLVLRGELEDIELEYNSVTQVLSELIRTAFIADNTVFHVCDFSAIEARVIAWLAGERWAIDAFKDGKDIYCETASQMFKVPVEKHGNNSHLRAKGKIAVLALGYGGGIKALEAMGGKKMGMSELELRDTVNLWRNANKRIVNFWSNCEKAAIRSIEKATATRVGCLVFNMWNDCLTITLPSKRVIAYPNAKVEDGITYDGMNQTTRKWENKRTYGGRLVENIVQSTARDILAAVLLKAKRKNYNTVFHVHDEIIVESQGESLDDIVKLFDEELSWAKGLPLKGAGYSTPYYIKD